MARPSTRELAAGDRAKMEQVFAELRAHFSEWSHNHENEHDLIGFAYYEGCGGSACCGAILAQAAPIALGKQLVTKHQFVWTMARARDQWHYAFVHPGKGLFIDLQSLEDGSWTDGADAYDLHQPGKRTHDSYGGIVRTLSSSANHENPGIDG